MNVYLNDKQRNRWNDSRPTPEHRSRRVRRAVENYLAIRKKELK
jgi:hypothetical protein